MLRWQIEAAIKRFWSQVRRARSSERCWPWNGEADRGGYWRTSFLGRFWNSHRLAWHLTHGHDLEEVLPTDVYVRHTCDVKLCCNPAHLVTGSAQDNSNDSVQRGRTNGGKPPGCSHRDLKPEIFRLAELGRKKSEIAKELGMSERNVFYHLNRSRRSSAVPPDGVGSSDVDGPVLS